MQENLQPPRRGRAALAAHEREVLTRMKEIRTAPGTKFFVDGDVVVIRWRFELDYADGRRTSLDEIRVAALVGDLIAEERLLLRPRPTPPEGSLAVTVTNAAPTGRPLRCSGRMLNIQQIPSLGCIRERSAR
jgi:hypothetical protein